MVTESNPGPTQSDCKSPVGYLKKTKVFKGTVKKCDLSENNVNIAIGPKLQKLFFLEWNNTTYILCITDIIGPYRSSLASLATLSGF